ncbi:DUF262 and HNHc domain-containing protein [Ktedonobacteria bacterium brp13]|nr:DUF262 and HNHc domain-containing protein [Ktedonobacteria bacterium brp13]
MSHRDGKNFIIDGQQRLTSITLLLIYLHNRQRDRAQNEKVDISTLIFSEKFGKKSFNLDIDERAMCIEALYNQYEISFDVNNESESIRNILARYDDIEQHFPATLANGALSYFIDWLKENVDLVEITTSSDEDAYTIFETMNDRGLSLSPTDMLKGYLLANITDTHERAKANDLWKEQMLQLTRLGKEEDADFFKAWFRVKAAHTLTPGMEYIFYNAQNNFTLQYPLLLAPLRPEDDRETAQRKIRLVAGYIDIFIARRAVNFRTLDYSSIVYTMFNFMKEIRELDVSALVQVLTQKVAAMEETFNGVQYFRLNQWSKKYIPQLLARMTHYIEEQSGVESNFATYISRTIKKPFEIEHIWANRYDYLREDFTTKEEFDSYRQRFGGLLLLQRGFNQSFSDKPYSGKLDHYYGQNLLAKSLHPRCYQNNPSFLRFLEQSGLPFQPYETFTKAHLDARQRLYQHICERIWSPDRFAQELV